MAARSSITSTRLTDTIVDGAPGRIDALVAMRGGIAAMSVALSAICDQADDERAEMAFVRSLDDLSAIDNSILSAPARSIQELRLQASIVRSRIAEETLGDQHLHQLLSSIEHLSGGMAG